jgi:hypothetical protein
MAVHRNMINIKMANIHQNILNIPTNIQTTPNILNMMSIHNYTKTSIKTVNKSKISN